MTNVIIDVNVVSDARFSEGPGKSIHLIRTGPLVDFCECAEYLVIDVFQFFRIVNKSAVEDGGGLVGFAAKRK